MEETVEKIMISLSNGRNILLHGPGGVGKSWLLRRLFQQLKSLGVSIFATATTGVAALGLCSQEMGVIATTLHRFAGIGLGTLDEKSLITKIRSDRLVKERWENCQILIIDEISMLGEELFTKLDAIAKSFKRAPLLPMGGIQLILSGDFLQLPPVKDGWVFNAKAWQELKLYPFILEKPYRYTDERFFQLLLRVRKGVLTEKDHLLLNHRVDQNQKITALLKNLIDESPGEVIQPTMFFSKRVNVDAFNAEELKKLPGESIVFTARDSFKVLKGQPNQEYYQRLLEEETAREIVLKVGAQVMLKINLDPSKGYVNGSRGVVNEINERSVIVKFLNGNRIAIEPQIKSYQDEHMIASRIQIPLVLAYAMTIHKSQGSTLDYIVVDLGPTVFAEGQAYVGLSRCAKLKDLFISNFVPNSIKANNVALKYVEELERIALEENS